MKLLPDIKEHILVLLGYPPEYSDSSILINLNREFYSLSISRINQIINELGVIDENLIGARTDSMATQLDTIGLDYKQHVNHQKSEGTRLLSELSNMAGIEVFYDKYSQKSMIKNNSKSSSTKYDYW